MVRRTLGQSGIQVSEISFGGVEIGMPYINDHIPSEKESVWLLRQAVDQGINSFDTARAYGLSEYLMGKAFQDIRSKLVISTKPSHFLNKRGKLPDKYTFEQLIDKSLSESLKALGTDYIDIYTLHQANSQIINSTMISDKLHTLKELGIIRAIGISTYEAGDTKMAINHPTWEVIQLPFNLLNQEHGKLFHLAEQMGVGIIIRSVLCRGLLSSWDLPWHTALSEIQKHITRMKIKFGTAWPNLPSLATKFALSYDSILSVLVGIDKVEYLNKACEVANGNYLSDEFRMEIEKMAFPRPDFLNIHQWIENGWLAPS